MPRGWGLAATKERGWVGSERSSERGKMKPQLLLATAFHSIYVNNKFTYPLDYFFGDSICCTRLRI